MFGEEHCISHSPSMGMNDNDNDNGNDNGNDNDNDNGNILFDHNIQIYMTNPHYFTNQTMN